MKPLDWDYFFVNKIKEGLSASGGNLTEQEERFLLTEMQHLVPSGLPPERALELQSKCITALGVAYDKDTAGKDRGAALRWRRHNEYLYKHSTLAIAGIVQNWYMTVGRAQEKKATGCLPVLILLALCLAALCITVAG